MLSRYVILSSRIYHSKLLYATPYINGLILFVQNFYMRFIPAHSIIYCHKGQGKLIYSDIVYYT